MTSPSSGFSTQVLPGAPVHTDERTQAAALVIFGATGDLASRKLLPGLYNLARDGFLPERFAVVGVGRRQLTTETFCEQLRAGVAEHSRSGFDAATWDRFARRISYVRGDHSDAATYTELGAHLEQVDRDHGTEGNRLHYLAVAASAFSTILHGLKDAGLIHPPGGERHTRVIIEKPFGRDLASAQALNRLVAEVVDESQTFRIDHYLGKETVQNILIFRFANAIFEPMWNRKYVDHVQITASESLGVGSRGRFYDETGALRDMVQSHLLQVLALTAMEPPVSLHADDVRDAKVQTFRSLRPILPEDVARNTVRAQYEGFLDEPNVDPNSRTPTFAALRLHIDNWRWHGVPFYVRTGKMLKDRVTEIAVQFRSVPLVMFKDDERCQRLEPNVLTLRVQPDEGITLRFASKVPGEDVNVASVCMDFRYAEAFDKQPQEAYERLLLDALRGDATLFWRRDGVERAWELVEPILKAWDGDAQGPLPSYAPGSTGPRQADELLRRDSRFWRPLE